MTGEKKKKASAAAATTTTGATGGRRSAPKIDWQSFVEKMEQSLLALKAEIIENLIAGNKDLRKLSKEWTPKTLRILRLMT